MRNGQSVFSRVHATVKIKAIYMSKSNVEYMPTGITN